MAIKPTCAKCGEELTTFGAILLGPPDENDLAKKDHLCKDCYEQLTKTLQ